MKYHTLILTCVFSTLFLSCFKRHSKEDYSKENTNKLEDKLPKSKKPEYLEDVLKIKILEDGSFYIQDQKISKDKVEATLQSLLKGKNSPTLLISAQSNSMVQELVFVMNIANKNKYKAVLVTE